MNRQIAQFFSPLNRSLTQLRQGNAIVMIPLSCLIGSLAIIGWLQYNTTKTESSVQHTQQVRLETQHLLTALLDAETEVRGYLLTNSTHFLDRYQYVIQTIPDTLSDLNDLVSDNPSQQQKLQAIRYEVIQRLDSLDRTLDLVHSQPDPLELNRLLFAGWQKMQATRSEIEGFLHEEERLNIQRTQRLQQQRDLSAIALLALATIGIGGSLLSAYLLRRLKQTLQEREERYRQLIELCPDGIFLEQNGQFVYANPATLQIYGANSLDELLGQSVLEFVHPDSRPTFSQRTQCLRDRPYTVPLMEEKLLKLDGETIYVEATASSLIDEGQLTAQFVIRDVTERKQIQQALFESKQRLDGILSSIEDIVWSVSLQRDRLLYLNVAVQNVFGYPVEAFFERPQLWIEMVDRRDRPLVENFNRVCIEQGYQEITYRIIRPDGEIRWLHDRAKLAYDDRGVAVRIDGIVTDITERQRAEAEIRRLNETLARRVQETETRYQQIVELAEEGIWVIDGNGITTYVNQAMARMLDYPTEEMIGQPLFNFMVQSDRDLALANFTERKQGVAARHEFRFQTKNGDFVWTNISTSPVLDENQRMLWACALVYDITDRKQAEEDLRRSSERISLINAELARATRLKDEFFASMSHELRTPLNAILGLSEALLEEVYGDLNDRQKRSLTTIEKSGQHLLELINDILDLSKIESGKMELQTTRLNVKALCESSLNFIKQQAHQKQLKVNLDIPDEPIEIAVDERRMRQVLVNLLSNAVKFTPDGGQISLKVEAQPENQTLILSVEDSGIGIAPDNIPKLFQPFVQLDSSLSRRYAGTGLGLSLVRRIVELHGGSISLVSEVDRGSTFTVSLPWQASQSPTEAPILLPNILSSANINHALIIEDSDPAAKQVARYLSELGTKVYIHPRGEGTLEVALQYLPDLIVLDLILPNLSGWEVLTQLKNHPQTRHIPILIVSVVDERQRAIALGANEYLVKPITRQQLQSSLAQIFSNPEAALIVTAVPEAIATPPLILIAEDNEANILTLHDYLQIHGFRVCLARNGLEAVLMVTQYKPQLILMDIQMPEMDGLEAIRRIRANPENVQIPIIALTALAMPGDRDRCLAAGAQEYMTKPVGLKKLVHQINQYLSS
ncbi:PAS domain S-box protein [Kamptonema cortianum]|nr:PAS domain S-box protein [Geitlerinema calcuttense]MDK3159187.1 PAS domain S-box protein [Kamptonema cortianum]